jgi:DNA polymerase (family 10)
MKPSLSKSDETLRRPTNAEIADRLDEASRLLGQQGANPFRVDAYRNAARVLRGLRRPAAEILDGRGTEGLIELRGIGRSLAGSIEQIVRTGNLPLLARLRGEHEPERLFATVAGIGPEMARRIHEALGIENLAELEAAARDGRLTGVPGFGAKRVRSVRESLAGRLRELEPGNKPVERARPRVDSRLQPPVGELLDIDEEYRHLARAGRLPRIAPRRFNPTHEAWLPVLHTQRGDRHYTALYSNTARAHAMGTNRDWVVIYRDDAGGDGQWTVITAAFGKLRGRRIVRGREAECEAYYDSPGIRAGDDDVLPGLFSHADPS